MNEIGKTKLRIWTGFALVVGIIAIVIISGYLFFSQMLPD